MRADTCEECEGLGYVLGTRNNDPHKEEAMPCPNGCGDEVMEENEALRDEAADLKRDYQRETEV